MGGFWDRFHVFSLYVMNNGKILTSGKVAQIGRLP